MPQPDIAVLSPAPDRYSGAHPTPADVLLIVEVSDITLHFDRGAEADLYSRHGVPELWIVDLAGRRIELLREPRKDGYAQRSHAVAGVLAVPGLALDVDLTALF